MKLFVLFLVTIFAAANAYADTIEVRGEVISVVRAGSYVNETVPYYACHGTNQLNGAIIGAVIGNQFGNGDGKTAMTVLGALAGANTANSQQCRIEWRTVRNYRDTGYITAVHDGYTTYVINTSEQFWYGDLITIRMIIQ